MSVFVLPTIVRKENGKVSAVKEDGMPPSHPIYSLNDLIFIDKLKNSLLEIADQSLDLSFFTTPNDSSYGNLKNVNTSFSPSEVLKCIGFIKEAFQERENEFVRPITYEGIFDGNGKQIKQAFIQFEEGKLLWKKKIDRWGSLSVWNDVASFQWYDDENKRWGKKIDLTTEKPVLYELINEGGKRIKGKRLDYDLKKSRFYDALEPELSNIEMLAKYAEKYGYELQIVHG